MKAGRPSYHIPAKWITVNLPQGILYFELDKKGNLLSKITGPHHTLPQASIPNRVPEVQVQTPQPLIENLAVMELDFFGLPEELTDFDFELDADL
jgi:hypothetical protein